MSRRLQISIVAMSLALLAWHPGAARALDAADYMQLLQEHGVTAEFPSLDELIAPEQYQLLANEVTALPTNLAFWLAQHLPATMSASGMGSGLSLSDELGLAIGVIPLRLGIFNQFDAVFESLTNADGLLSDFGVSEYLRDKTPPSMVWPQFGATIGVGLGFGIEVAVDVQFVPNLNVTLLDVVDVTIGVFSVSSSVRWRINDPWGPLPAFIIGVGGAYYTGSMTFAVGGSDKVPIPDIPDLPNGLPDLGAELTLDASYAFEVTTELEWTLYQVNPEVRLAWEFGPFQPYLGFGFGFTFGEVSGFAKVSAQIDIHASGPIIGEQSFTESFEIDTSDEDGPERVKPAAYTLRPHIGFDIDLGLFAITAQIDLAVMVASEDELRAVNSSVVNDVNTKNARTSVAVVGMVAARIQF